MTFEQVLAHLADESQPLGSRYLYALSDMTGDELDQFRQRWSDIGKMRRLAIVRQLVELTEVSFEVDFDPIFILALGDIDHEVRTTSIEGLWESEDYNLILPFLHLLRQDEDETVRATAASALGRFVLLGEMNDIPPDLSEMVTNALLEAIRRPEETIEVRRRAIEALAFSGRPGIRDIIRDAYESDDEKMQASALFAMGRSADPYWEDVLLNELENPNPEIRYEAARACGELELQSAVRRLSVLVFEDPDREVQEVAVWALGAIGGNEARRVLEACCETEDEILNRFAVEAIDQLEWIGDGLDFSLYDDAFDDEADEAKED